MLTTEDLINAWIVLLGIAIAAGLLVMVLGLAIAVLSVG